MLVLTRKTQQQIQIGPHITITILEVKGHSVRVGIVAPRDVNVFRTELAARNAQEQVSTSVAVAAQKVVPQATAQPVSMSSESVETSVEENPSVRCRAPRVAVAAKMKHPVRTGPASLGTRHPAPLNARLQGLLAR